MNAAGQPTLNNELRMVRSSLLYADHVDLIAPNASWVWSLAPLRGLDPDDAWGTVAALPPETLIRLGVEGVPLRSFRRAMRKIATYSKTDPLRVEGEQLWRPAVAEMVEIADGIFDEALAPELQLGLDTGDVRLISDGTRFEDDTEHQITWFRDRITEALASPVTTVLLDQVSGQFIRDEVLQGDGLSTVADERFRRSAIGTGLVERLPTFPDAPMTAVLEAREELADDRAKYRTSVRGLSNKLQSAALDDTLPSEIDEMWHDEVQPDLEGMRKTVTATRLAQETGKRLITEGFGIPTLFVTVANLAGLAGAITLPTTVALAGTAGRIAAAGAAEAFQARSAIRGHDLAYLLDLEKQLGNYRLD